MAGNLQSLPCGQASFASQIDNISRCYESGRTNISGDPLNHSPLHLPAFASSIPDATICVYKADIMTNSAAHYIREVLERKSFKVTHGYHQSLYVEAASLKTINTSVPPSHRSIIQQITLVPPEEVTLLYSPCKVFASAFWVRVKCGIYKNDVGYVLS
ncbi:hypothetical protein SCLCIDRAFT_28193 [Scleroderma citrinum Foug A]|uniref:Uncharacterized protein n=1 Tax=Scleroderma citrinum Foug A TaxID=1036808 RepID=A0A0C2Z8P5_9AGAM|nr:hypothetical protein SCLCIDRAFT_28193 [Scleroderma citrinum Foug A]